MDDINKSKSKKPKHIIKNNLYMLKLVWDISPSRILIAFTIQLLSFGLWIFDTVVFTRYVFGSSIIKRSFTDVATFVIFFAVLNFGLTLLQNWYYERYCLINNQLLYRNLHYKLFDKACNVEIGCFENSEFFNNYTKAANEVFTRAVSVVNNFTVLVASILSAAYVSFYMFTLNIFVGLMSLLPIITHFVWDIKLKNIQYRCKMDAVPCTRRQAYVDRVFYLQKYAKEIRLTNVDKVLIDTYKDTTDDVIKVNKKYFKSIAFLSSISGFFCFPLVFEGTWFIGTYLAMVSKTINVADFVVIASAVVSHTWMMINFSNSITSTYENALYTENLLTFLNYDENISENQDGLSVPKYVDAIELKNVSFKYEGSEKYVLKHLNLTFNKGEIVSLVGNNGSGKSTLVKLIMRLYDPTEGEILLNGINIKKYNLKQYRNIIGATFQDFQMFSLSVVDNVVMGNEVDEDEECVAVNALQKSGAYDRVMELDNGVQTTVTREFDDNGVNLSIGEAQKVAIARSFAKKASILLLDEPSSALDPIAEHVMFENFKELCVGDAQKPKISVFISHRLSSATVADQVYLLHKGEVIESGTHTSLMKQNGKYAEMFALQAENYLLEVQHE